MRHPSKVVTAFCLLALAALNAGAAPPRSAADFLEQGFRQPPQSAKPHTWWHWVNGNVSKKGITADLQAMKAVGLGGAQIFGVDCGLPAGPVGYMSKQWREMIVHAANEAGKAGIELCIHNCAGWSSSGGPWITPENAMQTVVWSETQVRGPVAFAGRLPQPPTRHGYYRDIAVFALPADTVRVANLAAKTAMDRADRLDPDVAGRATGTPAARETVFDLTGAMSPAGDLQWSAPAGDWVVIRIGYTPTGAMNAPAPAEGRGLEVDKLSRAAMDTHWAGMMGPILRDLGPLAGKVLNNSLIDSYEVGFQNWTASFKGDFTARRGYDLTPYLPILAGRELVSHEVTERFLWDFRRTVGDLFADNYYGYFAELCHKNGLLFSDEAYGNAAFDNLQCGGIADVPMGEFWVGGGADGTTKLAASAAHTNGRRYVGAESFTADEQRGRWQVDPYSIKALGDAVFCRGVNRYIFHRYAHQPWNNVEPGLTMGPWGMNLERTITWWSQAAEWMRYIARCQYMLQAGRFAADVCYYMGQSSPNDLPGRYGLQPELPEGYDYDGCDASVLLTRMYVRDRKVVVGDGVSYSVLVLPPTRLMSLEVARKVRDLVGAGAVVVGPRPERTPGLTQYPDCDSEVRRIAAEVWGPVDGDKVTRNSYGKGWIYWNEPLAHVLERLKLPRDFGWSAPNKAVKLDYIHRTLDGIEVYFVSNQKQKPVTVDCTFRVTGKRAELWSPDTGQILAAPTVRGGEAVTTLGLTLGPAGSVFVVFRPGKAPTGVVASARFTAQRPTSAPEPRIVIEKAQYAAVDGFASADVTAKVAAMVRDGETEIAASNELFGDPASLHVKELRVSYTVDGKPMTATAPENGNVVLATPSGPANRAVEMVARESTLQVVPWQGGQLELTSRSGRRSRLALPQPVVVPVSGPWRLRFDHKPGAPSEQSISKLSSWSISADPATRFFSGSATYTATVAVPAAACRPGARLMVDLGAVRNFAEITVNGKAFPTLWKPPFIQDVTGAIHPGTNSLEVRVTNLWPNRLIGDAQLPEEVQWNGNAIERIPGWVWAGSPPPGKRVTFATWRFYSKDSPLLESGLLGPVEILSVRPISVKP